MKRELSAGGNTFTAAEVDLQIVDLRLYYRDSAGKRFGRFEALRDSLAPSHQKLLFATNVGIFNPDFTPCGLHIENSVEISPLNLRDGVGNFYMKPNGVFLIDEKGAGIVNSSVYSAPAASVKLATQSGPLLVIDGQINSRLNRASTNKRIRSGVGVIDSRHVVFVLSRQPVTYRDFAAVFRDQLRCADALYLDGEISTFYFPGARVPAHDYAGMVAVIEK